MLTGKYMRSRLTKLAFAVSLLCITLVEAAGADAPARPATSTAHGFVTVQGRQLVAPDGAPLLLKGINLGNWLVPEGYMFEFETAKSPRAIYAAVERLLGRDQAFEFWHQFHENFVRRKDLELIAAAGFNTVRVPLHYDMFAADGGDRAASAGWALLDRLVDWCEAVGLYVVLDMHAAPGGQTGANHDDGTGYALLFHVPALQEETAAVWRAIAARYRNRPAILGYDLLNEPISSFSNVRYLNPKLEPLYRRLVADIRTIDPDRLIFLGGSQWNTNFGVFGSPFDRNLVYTYHNFWSPPSRAAIRQFVNFSYLYNVPIFLGESGEADDDWVKAFRELHERLGIGWCFWTYKNMASEATVARVRRPANWDLVVALADGGTAASADPAHPAAVAALAEYLENVKLENTTIQQGYLNALGLHDPR